MVLLKGWLGLGWQGIVHRDRKQAGAFSKYLLCAQPGAAYISLPVVTSVLWVRNTAILQIKKLSLREGNLQSPANLAFNSCLVDCKASSFCLHHFTVRWHITEVGRKDRSPGSPARARLPILPHAASQWSTLHRYWNHDYYFKKMLISTKTAYHIKK